MTGQWTRNIFAAMFAASAMVGAASAEDLRLAIDNAASIRLPAPADAVVVGNTDIASVSVQNDRMIFVAGHSYGATNLMVFDINGRVLYSGRVIVTPEENETVMVTRGLTTSRMDCTPLCRPRAEGQTQNDVLSPPN